MPIEIRELVIRTTIDNSPELGGTLRTDKQLQRLLRELKDEIVAECLRELKYHTDLQTER